MSSKSIFNMENNMDNITQQTEEMEALLSIFGDQWKIDASTGLCSITIAKSVKLYITLVPEYPSKSLPKYELLAPELTATQKQTIDKEIDNIFENGCGGPLIYQIILAIEDVVKENKDFAKKEPIVEPCNESFMSNVNIQESLKLEIFHGPIIEDRKSVFQGHVCSVKSKDEANGFMETLLQNRKIANATHNISAYRITLANNVMLQDCDDDGEHKAAGRLLDLIQTLKLNNIMVVVSRWYGGVQLGPDRFRHINNAARQALAAAGYVKS